jgi:hypothetical protein
MFLVTILMHQNASIPKAQIMIAQIIPMKRGLSSELSPDEAEV